ncbi:WRC-like protein [Cynara cardunculus var. scolymus]|uniref:WRC-like protein n=1 Tax=Cynara cardunculus var. scolymus TaxID=59895 RepID=A0A103Y1Z2_CYNCS|nr:WRC-like protein [Cynara cardunculus var. scolymus]
MVEKIGDEGGDCSLPDKQRCKRSDGRKWRCRRPVMQGRTLCEAHFAQSHYRKQREPVPDHLKLERPKPTADLPQIDEESSGNLKIMENEDVGCPILPQKRSRRKRKEENSVCGFGENPTDNLKIRANGDAGCSNLPPKQGKRNKREEKSSVDISEKLDDALRKMNLEKGDLQLDLIRGCLMRQVEKKKEKQLTTKENVVRDLKYGRLEISQSPVSSRLISGNNAGSLNVKVGVPASNFFPRRVFRSKNIEPLPIATMQILPSVKAKVKVAKKKCHWCRKCGYRNFIKCSTCKKHIFCEDCVQARLQLSEWIRCLDKTNVKKNCPVCCGTCDCRACIKERSKDVKITVRNRATIIVFILILNVHNPYSFMFGTMFQDLVVYNSKKKFDKSEQLLYMIDMLLPLLEQINQEKIVELNMEAKIKGKVSFSFCKSYIVDVHRRCENCSYMLCISCCWDFREGQLHGGFRDFKYMSTEKRKSLSTILWNWKTSEDGSIKCSPKNLGGCGNGVLDIRCLFDFNWTNELETSAKEIICKYKFTKSLEVTSCCSPSDGNAETGNESDDRILFKSKCLYLSMRDDLRDENLQHFTQHWVKGQPLIIRDVVKNDPELKWDPVFMFCTYLEASAKYQKDEGAEVENCSNWYEVEMGRKQIFMGGKTHANVQNEVLKFKVQLSSVFFQQYFPSHYAAVMGDLPLHEYINPLSGLLNLASKLPRETQNLDLGPLIYLSYGRPGEPIDPDFSTKLCYHAFDVVCFKKLQLLQTTKSTKLN